MKEASDATRNVTGCPVRCNGTTNDAVALGGQSMERERTCVRCRRECGPETAACPVCGGVTDARFDRELELAGAGLEADRR